MNFNRKWMTHLARILNGDTVTVRGFTCHEILNAQITVDMAKPVLTLKGRRLGYKFMCAEAHWILNADNRVKTIAPYSQAISQFSDDGAIFYGAYGPKIGLQWPYVVDLLREDPTSRQAVINIWRETPPTSKDIPCTLNVQFLVRDNRVHTIVNMRSSDAWLGIPYDVFNFSCLSWMVARALDLTAGTLYYNLGSAHLYERDLASVEAILNADKNEIYSVGSNMNYFSDKTPMDIMNWLGALKDWEKTDGKITPYGELFRARYS